MADSAITCQELQANGELYGLGIRVGIYFSWYATLVANIYVKSRIEDVSDTNTLFILANFIALASHSYRGEVNVVDVYIVLAIFFGYLFGGWSLAGIRLGRIYHTEPLSADAEACCEDAIEATCMKQIRIQRMWVVELHESFSQIGIFVRLGTALAIASYGVWFTFSGAQKLRPTDCMPTIFLFGRHMFFGPVNNFLKALALYALLLILAVTLPIIYVFIRAMLLNLVAICACVVCRILCDEGDEGLSLKDLCICCGGGCRVLILGLNTSRSHFAKVGESNEEGVHEHEDPTAENIRETLRLQKHLTRFYLVR